MKVIKERAIVLKTRRPHLITEKVKNYKILKEEQGVYKLALRWELHEAQVLAALKVKDVPSPIMRDYAWLGKHQPFKHQKETSAFLTLHKKGFCFNEQGTGKTASVIWAVDYLMQQGKNKSSISYMPFVYYEICMAGRFV